LAFCGAGFLVIGQRAEIAHAEIKEARTNCGSAIGLASQDS